MRRREGWVATASSSRGHSRWILIAFLWSWMPASAPAAVEISFYSREWANTFPHAFITLQGIDDRTGERIDASYGFTATHVSPAILLGSVKGEILSAKPDYIAKSDMHFRFTLSDPEYDSVRATVERWRTLKQPSYNLNRQNCVFFVADVAASLGMVAETPKALMKKPRSFTESLTRANLVWLQARGATITNRSFGPSKSTVAATR
ncbi:hypothetical protein [Sphingosinicella sp. LY1275]|uniref:hypothetical protein n=1 Tax=Sphingosinicella sp. LY1275 TaxID=3095379 RepID=UPI002ADEE418|nr:hypothetical protein [Sphingosinicella sp. LY1275]MEA1014490.1 hypothetical protein [Sphingosinicella sp. LY1275]